MLVLTFILGFALLLALVLLGDHVIHGYEHTKASKTVLLGESVPVLALGLGFGFWRHPESVLWAVLLGLAVAVPVYVVVAFLTVEVWSRRKQGDFDKAIYSLLREQEHWQATLDRLTWQLNDLERQKARTEDEVRKLSQRAQVLEDQLQAWIEERPEEAFSRRLMRQKWLEEFSGMSVTELAARKEQLQLAGTPEGAVEAMVVELALIRRAGLPGGKLGELEKKLRQCQEARMKAESRLQQIRQELRSWQERKTAFLRQRISLD